MGNVVWNSCWVNEWVAVDIKSSYQYLEWGETAGNTKEVWATISNGEEFSGYNRLAESCCRSGRYLVILVGDGIWRNDVKLYC